jgi:YfiH family protein
MEDKDIRVYEFEHLKKDAHIVHGVFTRDGAGRNALHFSTTDMDSGNGYSPAADNRRLITRKMGPAPLVFLNQVHGDTIKVLKKEGHDLSNLFEVEKQAYRADAAITDMKGVFLVIQAADCQSVMLYDPYKKVIANIHSGWRGSVLNIIGKCVDKMVLEFSCRPENLLAGISPSLGPCCSEFVHYKEELPEHLWKYKHRDKDFFDFWAMSRDQLMEKGIKKENIRNMKICTKCRTDLFYSYRGEKTSGRFACAISMI